MKNNIESISKEIIQAADHLHQKNYLAASDGNISSRISNGDILITPKGIPKRLLKSDDLSIIRLNGEVIKGRPSSETLMHLTIYRKCPQAEFIIHAHPPTAIAWSITRPDLKCLPSSSISEIILAVGEIPFVPYARPGTQEMGDVLLPFLPKRRAMILSHHGAISWGENSIEAFNGMERIEHSSEILWKAFTLGKTISLPEEEIEYLKKKRIEIGNKTL